MVDWTDAFSELIGFAGSFLAIGAIGFRCAIVPRWNVTGTDGTIRRDALHRAAIAGIIGAAITLVLAGMQAVHANAQQRSGALIGAFLALLATAGFLFAIARIGFGWVLAAIGVILGAFQPALSGKWSRLINPTHRFFAAMWIGTLFVLVVAGLSTILRDTAPAVERGRIARDLIAAFSPLALVSFAILAFFGMWTAWKHLKRIDALWTTPYGDILIAKARLRRRRGGARRVELAPPAPAHGQRGRGREPAALGDVGAGRRGGRAGDHRGARQRAVAALTFFPPLRLFTNGGRR
jgi:hypothetical protein